MVPPSVRCVPLGFGIGRFWSPLARELTPYAS